jgi:hypothetical protein
MSSPTLIRKRSATTTLRSEPSPPRRKDFIVPDPTLPTVREAIIDHITEVANDLAPIFVTLGASREWPGDLNFETTEVIAGLARKIGLPDACDPGDGALKFWRAVADDAGIYYREG